MKIKLTHKIRELTEEEISKRMRKDKLYYHCCGCGKIFEDKYKNILIVDLTKLNNGIKYIPRDFDGYKITSGYCFDCLLDKLNR